MIIMERSEPSLVPEWLKNSGSVTGVGTLRPHSSSSSHSDDHPGSKLGRYKSSPRSTDQDRGRSSSSGRISPSFSRRSYNSNGSVQSPSYSNFGRNNRSRDWDKDIQEYQEKNRKVFGDPKQKDVSPRSMFTGRFEKDGIRRSQSMISGRRSEVWPTKPSAGLTSVAGKSDAGANGLLDEKRGYVGSMHKVAMEKNFPPLGSEERQEALEVGRVPSPGLTSGIHTSRSNASAFSSGDKWVSALAEAPGVSGSSGTNVSSGQQASISNTSVQSLSTTTGLNMAEAVALGSSRAQTAPQLSTELQRLEELALKQSRQLIPVTPAMPKPLSMNSLDKVKGSKLGLPQHPISSPLLSPSVHGGSTKADVLRTGNTGKLQVLKPARERSIGPSAIKDCSSTIDSGKAVNSPVATAPSVAGSSFPRGPTGNPVSPTAQRKNVLTTVSEKRPTSQAQSRNDFFNLMRKKSMSNPSVITGGPPEQAGSSTSIQVKTSEAEISPAPAASQGKTDPSLQSQNERKLEECQGNPICNGDAFHAEKGLRNGKTRSSRDPLFSEEEEAAFLRSMGWEENSDEGGLTEEEISAFHQDLTKYMNSKPSLKFFQGEQPRVSLSMGSQAGTVCDAVSRLVSSDLKLES